MLLTSTNNLYSHQSPRLYVDPLVYSWHMKIKGAHMSKLSWFFKFHCFSHGRLQETLRAPCGSFHPPRNTRNSSKQPAAKGGDTKGQPQLPLNFPLGFLSFKSTNPIIQRWTCWARKGVDGLAKSKMAIQHPYSTLNWRKTFCILGVSFWMAKRLGVKDSKIDDHSHRISPLDAASIGPRLRTEV